MYITKRRTQYDTIGLPPPDPSPLVGSPAEGNRRNSWGLGSWNQMMGRRRSASTADEEPVGHYSTGDEPSPGMRTRPQRASSSPSRGVRASSADRARLVRQVSAGYGGRDSVAPAFPGANGGGHEHGHDRGNGGDHTGLDFDPDYDTSPEHLIKLFNILDRDHKGTITYEQMRMGLANLGTYSDLTYMMKTLELAKDQDVTLDMFVKLVQEHAAKIFKTTEEIPTKCFVYDYSPEHISWHWIKTGKTLPPTPYVTLEEFLCEDNPKESRVRWISMTGVDPSMIIRLSNKYGIHPLQVEDALNPAKERLKVDIFNNRLTHILLAKISLHEPCPGWPSNIQKEQVSIFLVDNHTVIFLERQASEINDRIANRLMYAGSKIRLNNALYMVYSIVDAIVDQMFPIMQHFHQWLVELQGKVHSDRKTPLTVVKAIQQINRDMNMLQFYLRPMKPVVTQLAKELPGEDAELRRHFEDLMDHVMVLEEQALRMITWSRSLNDDYINEQQHRMNQVMYILTMVTSAFLPAQFLTGVFGMNFDYMPELTWRYAYLMFWVLVAILAITVYRFYRKMNWL